MFFVHHYRIIPYSFPRGRIPDRQKNKHFLGGGETIGNRKNSLKTEWSIGKRPWDYIRGMNFQKNSKKFKNRRRRHLLIHDDEFD